MMWPWMMGGSGWWNWWMMIPMVLIWGLIIWGVVALVQRGVSTGGGGSYPVAESALELLKKRYARDEISKQEYQEKRRDIE